MLAKSHLLHRTDFEGYCEDETVRVVMSGNQEPRSVDFTEEALEQGSDVSHPPIPCYYSTWCTVVSVQKSEQL